MATGSPVVIRVLSTHLLDTNLVQKPGSTPSPLDSENLSAVAKTKLQIIHYLAASFSAIYFLWNSKRNNNSKKIK